MLYFYHDKLGLSGLWTIKSVVIKTFFKINVHSEFFKYFLYLPGPTMYVCTVEDLSNDNENEGGILFALSLQ